ncbi:MAG: hypothetical protein HONBIEJF_01984 [Fimbriimonadaceae bacterium]|nr:hypothetical protein [Fimbriimonadaceae bacterium]
MELWKGAKPLLLGAICLLTSAVHAQYDESQEINDDIVQAIRIGRYYYELAEEVWLANPIVVPDSVDGVPVPQFELRGSALGTTIRPLRKFDWMVRVGNRNGASTRIFSGDGLLSATIDKALMGARTVQVRSNGILPGPGQYVVIVDQSKDNAGNPTNAELVRVAAVDQFARNVTLDRPLGRPYTKKPAMRFVDECVGRNVTVKNLVIYGNAPQGDITGGVLFDIVGGGRVENVVTRYFATDNIRFNSCRDIVVDNCRQYDYRGNDDGGMGRGCALFWCKDVTIQNCHSANMRHGVAMVASSSDVLVRDSVGDDTIGHSFDVHGQRSYRVKFLRCSGKSTLQIGNGSFLTGDRDCEVEDCNVKAIYVVGDERRVKIKDSRANWINFQTWGSAFERYFPKEILIEGCVFRNNESIGMPLMFSGGPYISIHNLSIINSEFHELKGAPWRAALFEALRGDLGVLTLTDTLFRTTQGAPESGTCFEFSGSQLCHVTINATRCTFERKGSNITRFKPGITGELNLFDCQFIGEGEINPVLNETNGTLTVNWL